MAQIQNLAHPPCTPHRDPFVELRQSLPSQVEAISAFVDQFMLFIASHREADGSEIDIEIALRAALTNAVVHGNGESPNKRVYVVCRSSAYGEFSITVRDQGQGFDHRVVPHPTAPEKRLSTHGRGIYLMGAFMDEVCFEEGRSVVHMRKMPNAGSAAQWNLE